MERPEGAGLSATSWSGSSGGGVGEGEAPNLEAYAAAQIGLKDHLEGQLTLATRDPIERLIGQVLIDSVDDAGYYAGSLAETAARLADSDRARRARFDADFKPSIPPASARATLPNASRSNCANGTASIRR